MKKLIFIHGAFGTEADLKPLAELCSGFQIELLRLPFHGPEAGPHFNYQTLKEGLLNKLSSYENYSLFGYSLGGYLALDLASSQLINPLSITTYGTRFFWTEELVQKISGNMVPDSLMSKLPDYAHQLEKMHGKNWQNLIQDTLMVMNEMVQNPMLQSDFAKIQVQTKLIVGDKDLLVSPEETKNVSQSMLHSSFEILPEGVHDLSKLDERNLKRLALSAFKAL